MTGAYEYDVFISHASKDKPRARQIAVYLRSNGLSVWFDESSVPPGGHISHSILAGLQASRTLVFLLSPDFLHSDWASLELHTTIFRDPLNRHRRFIPVLIADCKKLIPDMLRPYRRIDLRQPTPAAYAELLAACQAAPSQQSPHPPPPTPPSNIPLLPPHYLQRPALFNTLKHSLLASNPSPLALIGAGSSLGVHGMGGVGKTVLATALALDPQVQLAFPDGIVWLTIGRQETNITARQYQLAQAMGDRPRPFKDAQQGRAYLENLLRAKTCLIILDDIWDQAHAEAFNVLALPSRLLITTRDAAILRAIGADSHDIDPLDPPDALRLLADWADIKTADLPPIATKIAHACGYLPLALAMIGAMIRRRPTSWADAMDRLDNADLHKLRREFPNYPYPDLLAAIEVSVNALSPDDREHYLDFAVFPEDTPVPEAALETYWVSNSFRPADVHDLLDRLVDLSLLHRSPDGRLSLHDLQLDYVRKYAGDLPARHRRLLDAYRLASAGHWHMLPRDGYIHRLLAYHLAAAGLKHELRHALLDYRFLQAKLDATDANSLLADYDHLGPDDAPARLVQSAIRLSAHVLADRPGELPGQLLGRLSISQENDISALLASVAAHAPRPCLLPSFPSLDPPGGPLLRTLKGHTNWVNAVAVTPDGKRALSASDDNTLKIWDLHSGTELRTLKGHTECVTAVAVTPDGKLALSASWDNTLKIWDLHSGTELRTLKGHTHSVTAVAITPDGKLALSASYDNTLKIWDLNTGRVIAGFTADAPLWSCAVAPDGRTIVAGDDGGHVHFLLLTLPDTRPLSVHRPP